MTSAPEPRAVDSLQAGHQAFRDGAWSEAAAQFRASLAIESTPDALEGLSWAAWWLNDADTVFDSRERAYRAFEAHGDRYGAARMASWLATDYVDFRGQLAIANGWRQRANRLLDGLPPTREHGWNAFLSGEAALFVEEDPANAQQYALKTMILGRELGLPDLEILGLALEGIALVSLGEVNDGMSRLDEAAVAVVTSELDERFTAGLALCYLIFACERVRDYERAAQWCEKLREYALRLEHAYPLGICHAHYASVLTWQGVWTEAESELTQATSHLERSRPGLVGECMVRLGELRRRQGQHEEAGRLFGLVDGHPLAMLGQAEIALDEGKAQLAEDVIDRLLRQLPIENQVQRFAGLELLVRAQASLGSHAKAAESLQALRSSAAAIGAPPLQASAHYAAGALAASRGASTEARGHFEDAIRVFARCGAPYETARSRAALAESLAQLGRLDLAKQQARAAIEIVSRIGAEREVERITTFLRRLDSSDPTTPSRSRVTTLTAREIDVLRLVAQGMGDREIATQLVVSEHTVHRHVANILTKLDRPSRAAAVAHAARDGLL